MPEPQLFLLLARIDTDLMIISGLDVLYSFLACAAGDIVSRLAIKELRETVMMELVDKKTVSLELIRELLVRGFRKANE